MWRTIGKRDSGSEALGIILTSSRKRRAVMTAPLSVLLVVAVFLALAALTLGAESQASRKIDEAFAAKVAEYYATQRWEGARVGEGELYYSLAGEPEVYFFLVFKKGTAVKPAKEIAKELSALRKRRLEAEKQLAGPPGDNSPTMSSVVRSLWAEMSASDKYGTVVIGAHEGREPFVASFAGLPPHLLLGEDAEEKARGIMDGRSPAKKTYLWAAPLFTGFRLSAPEQAAPDVFLEARGTELVEVKPSVLKREAVSPEMTQERGRKWQAVRRAINGD